MKKLVVFLLFALMTGVAVQAQNPERPGQQPAPETGEKFKIGMAGYTFVKFDLDKTLETLQKADVHYLCIKDFHLPFKSTDAE
ncbi:MAG: sugar phosphate isomerase/epimerase, partial [Bacteroidota bacterium]|nr:sugar phosphate isomerase/epimerase [Bacteroidota bacterium]